MYQEIYTYIHIHDKIFVIVYIQFCPNRNPIYWWYLILFFQDLLDFLTWFDKNITERYRKNSADKLRVSDEFTSRKRKELIISIQTFRENTKEQFDNPMSSCLTESSQKMKKYYKQILSQFIKGQVYFGAKMNFRKLGSAMNIWRTPVS